MQVPAYEETVAAEKCSLCSGTGRVLQNECSPGSPWNPEPADCPKCHAVAMLPQKTATVSADEIVCPLTGEIISADDVDGMAEMYARLDERDKEIYAVKTRIRRALAKMTTGDKNTRRIEGKRHRIKVVMPAAAWVQGKLQELWNSHPEIARKYLAIERIKPQLREVNKLRETTVANNAPLEFFKNALLAAEQQPTAAPTITVETINPKTDD